MKGSSAYEKPPVRDPVKRKRKTNGEKKKQALSPLRASPIPPSRKGKKKVIFNGKGGKIKLEKKKESGQREKPSQSR